MVLLVLSLTTLREFVLLFIKTIFIVLLGNIVEKSGNLVPIRFLGKIRKVEARIGKLAKIRKVETDKKSLSKRKKERKKVIA